MSANIDTLISSVIPVTATTDGNIKFDCAESGTLTLPVIAGVPLNFIVKKVYSTGTTASGIVIGY